MSLLSVQLLCLLPIIATADRIFPPNNTFCFLATGEFIFEERIRQLAPSAKLQGVGTISVTEHLYIVELVASISQCIRHSYIV